MGTRLDELMARNRRWALETERHAPGFFTGLQAQQAPKYLWIGCADSRVPANELVGLAPGELFVHRNIANLVVHSDLNCLSVVQFATDVLQVKHIIVVGHSNCNGVGAALRGERVGLADNWIRHVKDVFNRHQDWLESLPVGRRTNALCELNVVEQALNVCQSTVVHDAWKRGQDLEVHGWVYGLHNGRLEDLAMSVSRGDDPFATYHAAIATVRARHAAGAVESAARLTG
jgi:carbonic anhydrase